MRKLAVLLVLVGAAPVCGQDPNLLLYEGFNYDAGLQLAPAGTTDQTAGQGLQHAESGLYWFSAGTGVRPTVTENNVWIDIGLPAPRDASEGPSNSVALTSIGANGTSTRIGIPYPEDTPSAKTVYWSGFFRVDDIDDLGSAPGQELNEAGATTAGFNNNLGSQTNTAGILGGLLAIKRASINPDSPRFRSYYAGTATNSAAGDCNMANNYACAERRYADYDPALDDPNHPLYISDLPTTYKTAGADQRSKFSAVPLAEGETVFFVGSLEIVEGAKNDVARLWINPDPSSFRLAAPPEPNVVAPTVNGNDMNSTATLGDERNAASFFLRNNGGSGIHGPELALFDELRLGLTWASVTGGAIAPPAVAGDYNSDGTVDAADYVVWRDNLGATESLPNDDTPGVGEDDYVRWSAQFGDSSTAAGGLAAAVPEPSALSLLLLAGGLTIGAVKRSRPRPRVCH